MDSKRLYFAMLLGGTAICVTGVVVFFAQREWLLAIGSLVTGVCIGGELGRYSNSSSNNNNGS